MTGAPVLVAEGVGKAFGQGARRVVALDGVSVAVRGARLTGLVGPDGAGKTTFLRLAAGLMRPDRGRLTVLGHDAARAPAAVQAGVGYMPQRFGLYEDLTVAENLSLHADLRALVGPARRARIEALLALTRLGPFTARLAGRLSGGMKQKLGLACTLLRPPPLLLLDEPGVGVDPVSRRDLWSMVRALADRDGIAVVWATAALDEAGRCDEVILLARGHVLGQDVPEAFQTVTGRTYRIARARAPAGIDGLPGVLDAVRQGDWVRLLLAEGAALPPALLPLAPEPVAARFEDAFILRMAAAGLVGGEAVEAPPEAVAPVAATPAPATPVPAAPPPPAVELVDLRRDFGAFRAVDGVSLTVAPGEVYGLLGPNGAGKSTIFRILAGLLAPSAGAARVQGIDLRHAAARARARVGYMAQRFSLYGDLTVAQNLRFFAGAHGLSGARAGARIAAQVEAFALGDVIEARANDLSLGYKQRLALAVALLHEPRVLLLDEPTSGVDPLARRAFWRRIGRVAAGGVGVVVTTHFLEEAEYCDRVGIVYRGRLIAEGAPGDLARRAGPDATLEDAFIALIEAAPGGAAEVQAA